MRTLGIETSGSHVSFALATDGEIEAEVSQQTAMDLSRSILQWIDDTLRHAQIAASQITGIGVSLGPGSWTGLRIGVATAKTLAQGLGIPLAGIPTFEALAHLSVARWSSGSIIPLAPSRRGEVFASFYRIRGTSPDRSDSAAGGDSVELVEAPLVCTLAELIEKVTSIDEPVHFCGEGVWQYGGELSRVFPEAVEVPPLLCRAATIAQLAAERINREQYDDAEVRESLYAVKPIYLLPSEAERKAGKNLTV